MKKILIILFVLSLNNQVFAAGSDSSSDTSGSSLYDQAVKLVKRAGKLEKKEKDEKAKKLIAFSDNLLNRVPFVKDLGGILIIDGKKMLIDSET